MKEIIEAAYLSGFEPSRDEINGQELYLETEDFLCEMGIGAKKVKTMELET